MKEKWVEYARKADFDLWSRELGISKLTARILRNRGVETLEEAREFLFAGMESLADARLMKGMNEALSMLSGTIRAGGKTAIVSDFDDDGIFAGEILYEGIRKCGGEAMLFTPHRVREGYGINRRIIDEAAESGCSLILTCDNGIAALPECLYARERGCSVIVTDHHEVQYDDAPDGTRTYRLPEADAVVDPKQPGCAYPFKELCGAGVAFRLIQLLYREFGVPEEAEKELYEYLAIATVADVVPLKGENRILVKAGLEALHRTKKTGLLALIEACGLKKEELTAYHLGFVIGPSFNAVGRLADVRLAFRLLSCEDAEEAADLAGEIRALNEARKDETERGTMEALSIIEKAPWKDDRILLVRLHGVHESVVGIIAGRVKEKYHRPVFVFTDAEDGLKGSGRSIENYHMLAGLIPEKGLLTRFGGHAMAAGLSLPEENLEILRKRLNEACTLTESELQPVVHVDARVPLRFVTEKLIGELSALAPFGTGNPRPVFAMTHLKIRSLKVVGRRQNVVRMTLQDEFGTLADAVHFGDPAELTAFIRSEYGEAGLLRVLRSEDGGIDPAFTFYPEINEYMGRKSVQIVCMSYCRIR